jgi:hypothetical protein
VFHVRFTDFHHDLASVGKARGVYLTDGSARRRLAIEECEQLVGRRPEFLADDLVDFSGGNRWDGVLQFAQRLSVRFRQQIAARREQLAQFDERRSEFFARLARVPRAG